MKQDVRILELSKQHYFDDYDDHLGCDYSCWGYYDGINIYKAFGNGSKLFDKKTSSPISTIWFGMGESIERLNGKYSKQNIGIFRYSDSQDKQVESFWKSEYSKSPYLAISFVHIKDQKRYKQVADKFEKMSTHRQSVEGNESKYRRLLSYFTFDNIEVIVLIRSNSLLEIDYTLREIEEDYEVSYTHSIVGVSEVYLEECYKDGVFRDKGQIKGNLDEEIQQVDLRMVTSGERNTIEKMKYLLQKQNLDCKQMTVSHMSGHANYLLQIEGIKVRNVLEMMISGGVLTHRNPLYGSEIYNIETQLYMQKKDLSDFNIIPSQGIIPKSKELWGITLIEKYVKRMRDVLEKLEDEGLYSYYRALIQTLNTLTQYEGFSLSENIFLLLQPAFKMFDEQLECAVIQALKDGDVKDVDRLKEAVCEFLNAVNIIIYHIVHTDQIFLMVPGYSGTSFSIPIKLCLMYLGIADSVVKILNEEKCKYTFLLTPEMETRPETSIIDMGVNMEDRLVHLSASQRSLYMPRHFIMILTHEIAHYVGKDIRKREMRCEYAIKTIACFVAEGILPEGTPVGIDGDVYQKFCQYWKEELKNDCKKYLMDKIKQCPDADKYHERKLKSLLIAGCREYLADDQNGASKLIMDMNVNFGEEIAMEDYLDFIEELYEQQKWTENNKNVLLCMGIIEEFIQKTLGLYKEIFSDIAAMLILNCDIQTFMEAFHVSEGVKIDSECSKGDNKTRALIIRQLFDVNCKEKIENTGEKEVREENILPNWLAGYRDCFYQYRWVAVHLLAYGEECKKSIENQINKMEVINYRNEVRELFKAFWEPGLSCAVIHERVMGCINNYLLQIKSDKG